MKNMTALPTFGENRQQWKLATRMIDMGGVKPQGQGRVSCRPLSLGNGSNVDQQAERKYTRR